MLQVETLRGGDIVARLDQLIHEGNVRRIIVKHEGHTIAEFPVTLGVIGALLAARVVAIAAMATVLSDCTIEVIRDEEAMGPQPVAAASAEDVLVAPPALARRAVRAAGVERSPAPGETMPAAAARPLTRAVVGAVHGVRSTHAGQTGQRGRADDQPHACPRPPSRWAA